MTQSHKTTGKVHLYYEPGCHNLHYVILVFELSLFIRFFACLAVIAQSAYEYRKYIENIVT
jgi:hypothetical protein